MAKKKKYKRAGRRTSTGRVYVAVIMMFMIVVMAFQIVNLYRKNAEYMATEESLQKQVDSAREKQQELADYEQYVGSDQYIEDEASKKLGLTHDNWIIFREEQD